MLSISPIELFDHQSLVTYAAGHPVPRWHHSPSRFRRGWGLGAAVGWTMMGRYRHVLVAVGDGRDAARLVSAVPVDVGDLDRVVVAHLRAIATHPDHRGRGLGADITAAVTRRGLDAGAPAATLGMYSENDVARRLYERLGFRVGQAFASCDVSTP